MKSRRTIEYFIELRALGKPYKEIIKKTGVSKPTLIKWGKIYKEEIEKTKLELTKKLAERIVKNNSELITGIAENLKRAAISKIAPEKLKINYIKKSYKKLGDIFKIKVTNIELTINKQGEVERVYISCD